MGYTDVVSVAGGYGAWKNAGLPTAKPQTLTKEQQARYSRHLLVPEVGEAGQLKLLASKVLLIGAGGLGAPSAFYLAAAGVGTLGIIDNDLVEESNLQRQIIHTVDRIGQYKADSAAKSIAALNPDIKVNVYKERLTADNIENILPDYDIVVDGTDNFETRYLVNDFAVKYRKPVIHASILSFDGQLTTLVPYEGPCYRCIYPDPPPASMAPNCSEAGVLGVLPGIIGLLQTNEAIKTVLGIGETLAGRFLLFDALQTEFTELKLRRDPNCVACGEHADIDDLLEQHKRGDVLIPACRISY
jgi:molybdopterin/thiamine biosynthesis adenylyltransferase